jgi:hypothetical protein
MKLLPLTNSTKSTIVDDDAYEWASKYRWILDASGYASRSNSTDKNLPKMIRLHREIMNHPEGQSIDHKDRDKLNNQKSNLRICTPSQNMANKSKTHGSSRFKGVSWVKDKMKWCAFTKKNRKTIPLGCFNDEVEAAKVYNTKMRELHGEFALLNEV